MSNLPGNRYWHQPAKRLGEDRFFSGAFVVFRHFMLFFLRVLFGSLEIISPAGRGGAIPSLGEIRNCHINVGTGKELTIRELSDLVVNAVGFEGEVEFDTSKPDGTMRKASTFFCVISTKRSAWSARLCRLARPRDFLIRTQLVLQPPARYTLGLRLFLFIFHDN